jgi:hypothetical protein
MATSAQELPPQSCFSMQMVTRSQATQCDSMRIHAALIAVAKGEMDRAGVAAVLRELTA